MGGGNEEPNPSRGARHKENGREADGEQTHRLGRAAGVAAQGPTGDEGRTRTGQTAVLWRLDDDARPRTARDGRFVMVVSRTESGRFDASPRKSAGLVSGLRSGEVRWWPLSPIQPVLPPLPAM